MEHAGLLLTLALKWTLGIGAIVLWVWAAVRALMRGQMIWLVIITFLGPFGAIAYLAGTAAGDRTRATYGLGSTRWQPPRRR